jgi:hypothetical protein
MNIDGLQELAMNRSMSSTKPDTTRYAIHLNVLFPPLAWKTQESFLRETRAGFVRSVDGFERAHQRKAA